MAAVSYGAGILFFSYAPNGTVHFVMARNSSQSKSVARDRFCDLGGWARPGEGVEECACREAVEESAGLLDISPDELADGQYTLRVDLDLNHGNPKRNGKIKKYVTFVKEVPWQPDLSVRFHMARQTMLVLDRVRRRLLSASPHELVSDGAAISIRISDSGCCQVVVKATGAVVPLQFRAALMTRVRNARRFVFQWSGRGPYFFTIDDNDETAMQVAQDLVELCRCLVVLPYSVACAATSNTGHLPEVPKSHQEKTEVVYWDARRLLNAIEGQSKKGIDELRSSFVPSAAVVMDCLRSNDGTDAYTVTCHSSIATQRQLQHHQWNSTNWKRIKG